MVSPRCNNTAPAVAQQLSLNRAELERRAQHIFERFQDDGTFGISSPETAYAEIEGDLNGLNSADVKALREIYSQRYSPQRGGRDLLLDIRSEIPQMSDQLKAFRILAPITAAAADARSVAPSGDVRRACLLGAHGGQLSHTADSGDGCTS